jgi:pyocin large subunit-like protein
MRTRFLSAAGIVALLALTACGNSNPAGEAARDHSDRLAALPYEDRAAPEPRRRTEVEPASAREETRPRTPAPSFHGKPMWADSRKYSAEENARYQFDQHGDELGAKSLDDFLEKAHAFTATPPKGAKTATRANGDTLIYDARSGLFAVARSDGAPRTLFKPTDGEAYWAAQQKGLERASARRSDRRDEG